MVNTTPNSNVYLLTDYRKQVCPDGLWASTARQPPLPDRDAVTTNAWTEAYSLGFGSSLDNEEDERILWPRGVCAYSCPYVGWFTISDISSSHSTGGYEYGGLMNVSERIPFPLTWDNLD